MKAGLVTADTIVVALAMALALRLRAWVPGHEMTGVPSRHFLIGALTLPLWVGMFFRYRLYSANHTAGRRAELGRLAHAVGASVVGMALTAFAAKLYVARGWLALTYVVSLTLLAVEREVIRRVLTGMRSRGQLMRRVLIVGGNDEAREMCSTLVANPQLGYQVLGFVADGPLGKEFSQQCPVVGAVPTIGNAVRSSGADGVILITSALGVATANRLARDVTEMGVHVEMVAALRDIAVERLDLRTLGPFPILHIDRVRRNGWRAFAKRGFDVVLAGTALILLAPLLAIAAVAVKLSSPGPVLFRQTRLGRDGTLFTLVKFRTMVVDAHHQLAALRAMNEAGGPLFKIRRDPRITPVGRLLRRLSIDELPQLWNVLRNEMSLVGPRPAIPDEVVGWTPDLHQRLRVKPGLTGMWQVCGRNLSSFDEYCRLDLYYVDNWSLLVDLTILFKTIPAVVSRRRAC